jgi:small-conductance mechanosensitive channel
LTCISKPSAKTNIVRHCIIGILAAENATSALGIPGNIDLFGTPVAPLTILLTIVIIVAGYAIAHFVRIVSTRYIGSRLPPDTRRTLGKTLYYVIIAIALLSALGVSGINLSGLFLAGGIAGIVIGFAMQPLFSNLISGVFLQIDKPMKIGDPVLITGKLPDVAGVVVEITTLSSRLRMFDGTYVRLPNSDVFLSEIRNYSNAAARRVEISVRIAYKEDVGKVVELIRKSLMETPLVLVEPEPDVYVDNLGDSAVNINVWCWVPFSVWFDMRKHMIQLIKRELDANGIEIPFPQRVVYLAKQGRRRNGVSTDVAPEEIREGLNIDEYVHQSE